jgi:hypothetical protein
MRFHEPSGEHFFSINPSDHNIVQFAPPRARLARRCTDLTALVSTRHEGPQSCLCRDRRDVHAELEEASMKFTVASLVWMVPVGVIALFVVVVAVWHFFAWMFSPFPRVTAWFDRMLRRLSIYSQ